MVGQQKVSCGLHGHIDRPFALCCPIATSFGSIIVRLLLFCLLPFCLIQFRLATVCFIYSIFFCMFLLLHCTCIGSIVTWTNSISPTDELSTDQWHPFTLAISLAFVQTTPLRMTGEEQLTKAGLWE